MMSLKEQIAVMQACADGKAIETRPRGIDGGWIHCFNPSFDWFSQEYRVAPPKPDEVDWSAIREEYRWIARQENGDAMAYPFKPFVLESGWYSEYQKGQPLITTVSGFLSSYRNNGLPWRESLIERPCFENNWNGAGMPATTKKEI